MRRNPNHTGTGSVAEQRSDHGKSERAISPEISNFQSGRMIPDRSISVPQDTGPKPATPTKSAPDMNEPASAAKNTTAFPEFVNLQHRFFTVFSDTYFRKLEHEPDAVMVLPLGKATVVLKLTSIERELGLAADSPDVRMLQAIAQALEYVPRISNEDPLPQELLTGVPSWEILEEHVSFARAKVAAHIIEWVAEDENLRVDQKNYRQFLDDPETKSKIKHAFREAAEHLGFGRENAQHVTELVNTAAMTLASVEALRSRISVVQNVARHLEITERIHEKTKHSRHLIKSNRYMLNLSLRDIRDRFDDIDDRFIDIVAALKNLDAFLEDVKRARDEIRRAFWAWTELEDKWRYHRIDIDRSTEDLLSETFRFLSQRYLPEKQWDLIFQVDKFNGFASFSDEMRW